jgi:hypothetical protein
MSTYRYVSQITYDIPNFKDKNQWLAGGSIRNDTWPGGDLYSPDRLPSFNNRVSGVNTYGTALNTGEIMMYLNRGFAGVLGVLSGWEYLDLINDFKVKDTVVVTYTLTITNADTGEVLYISSGDNNSSNGNIDFSFNGKVDYASLARSWGAKYDLIGVVSRPSLLNIAVTIRSALFGDLTVEETVRAGLLGSVTSGISTGISKAVVSAVGTTNVATALGIGIVVGLVVGELIELALGLDNHFGFGGELVGTDSSGQNLGGGIIAGVNDSMHPQYSPAQTVSTGLSNMFTSITDFLGITYNGGISIDDSNLNTSLTDIASEIRNIYGDDMTDTLGLDIATGRTTTEDEQRGVTPGDVFGEGNSDSDYSGSDPNDGTSPAGLGPAGDYGDYSGYGDSDGGYGEDGFGGDYGGFDADQGDFW